MKIFGITFGKSKKKVDGVPVPKPAKTTREKILEAQKTIDDGIDTEIDTMINFLDSDFKVSPENAKRYLGGTHIALEKFLMKMAETSSEYEFFGETNAPNREHENLYSLLARLSMHHPNDEVRLSLGVCLITDMIEDLNLSDIFVAKVRQASRRIPVIGIGNKTRGPCDNTIVMWPPKFNRERVKEILRKHFEDVRNSKDRT